MYGLGDILYILEKSWSVIIVNDPPAKVSARLVPQSLTDVWNSGVSIGGVSGWVSGVIKTVTESVLESEEELELSPLSTSISDF